jgi:hypothetical protein
MTAETFQGSATTLKEGNVLAGFSAAMIQFDLNGRKLALEETIVQKLQAEALARAGSSTTLNDLAVILSRALSERKPITLRRAESRALEQLLNAIGP